MRTEWLVPSGEANEASRGELGRETAIVDDIGVDLPVDFMAELSGTQLSGSPLSGSQLSDDVLSEAGLSDTQDDRNDANPTREVPPMIREPLSVGQSAELARTFKAIADPARLRLLSLLAAQPGGEACVCDLTDAFELTGPTISHHLKVLREAGLVTQRRRGTWIYYRPVPDGLRRLTDVLAPIQVGTPEPAPV